MLPNIAIIRWTDDSFLQIEWEGDRYIAKEFSTLSEDDSYNSLNLYANHVC